MSAHFGLRALSLVASFALTLCLTAAAVSQSVAALPAIVA